MRNQIVTPVERLAFVAGIPTQTADEVLRGKRDLRSSSLDAASLEHAAPVDLPSIETLLSRRVPVDMLSQRQIRYLPGLPPARIETVVRGGPYFTIEEFEGAARLSRSVLAELIDFPVYRKLDKTTGRTPLLRPAPGVYIADDTGQFEAREDMRLGAYRRTLLREREADFCLYKEDSFERVSAAPHELKRALGGRVTPALIDDDGCTRYIVPLRIDVWFHRKVPMARALKLLETAGLEPERFSAPFSRLGFYPARLPSWPIGDALAEMLAVAARVQQFTEVLFAEPDEFGLDDFPPTRDVPAAGSFEVAGQYWNHDAIELEAAHARTIGSGNVTIFVIDSGVRLDHPDIKDSLRAGWETHDLNFCSTDPPDSTSPEATDTAHGTHVAGVAAGAGRTMDAMLRTKGIAPGCRLLPIKISGSPASSGYGFRAAAIMQALDILQPGERGVINISWGMAGDHIGIRQALIEADRREVPVVCSAGNYRPGEQQAADKLHYPSAYIHMPPKLSSMCSVAAFNSEGRRSTYSYFGAESVSVAAPGGESGGAGSAIFVADILNDYTYAAGTSFAAPHVAGLLALMLSIDPTMGAGDAIGVLQENCLPFSSAIESNWDRIGRGKISAARTLSALAQRLSVKPEVPSVPVAPSETAPPVVVTDQSGRVDVNSASREQLLSLPEVNDWLIDRLLAYRSQFGAFPTIWHLVFTGAWDFWQIARLSDRIAAT